MLFLRQILNCCFCAISSRELSASAIFYDFSTMVFAFVYFCLCPRNHLQTLEGPFVGRQGDSCLLFARRVHFHPIQQSPPIISTMPRAPQPPVEFTWCPISKICQLILQFIECQITDIYSIFKNYKQILNKLVYPLWSSDPHPQSSRKQIWLEINILCHCHSWVILEACHFCVNQK